MKRVIHTIVTGDDLSAFQGKRPRHRPPDPNALDRQWLQIAMAYAACRKAGYSAHDAVVKMAEVFRCAWGTIHTARREVYNRADLVVGFRELTGAYPLPPDTRARR
jgi:hypothetical protein